MVSRRGGGKALDARLCKAGGNILISNFAKTLPDKVRLDVVIQGAPPLFDPLMLSGWCPDGIKPFLRVIVEQENVPRALISLACGAFLNLRKIWSTCAEP